MHRQFSCGALALKGFLSYHKNIEMFPRGDIFTFKDIIDEAKFYSQLIPQKTLNLVKVTPCIVKFGNDHFVLVAEVLNGLVYYFNNGSADIIPLDDFYGDFKGYVLSETVDNPEQILKESECLQIVGHKKGGFAKQIVPIVLSIGGQLLGIPAPLTYAAAIGAQTGMGEYARGRHPEQLGKPGQVGSILGDVAQGALTAYGGTQGIKAFQVGQQAAKARAMGTTPGFGGQMWAGGRTLLGMSPTSAAGAQAGLGTQVANVMGKPVTLGQTAQGGGFTYIPNIGWKATTPSATAGLKTTSNIASNIGGAESIPGAGTAGTAGATGAESITQQLLGQGSKSYLPSLLAGGVSAGMELPELPDLEANYRQASQRILGGSPLSTLASNRATAIMQGEPLTKEDEQAILNIFNDREKESLDQINKQYQTVGRLGSEEHQEQVRKGKEYWATQKAYGLYGARKDAQAMQNQVMQASWGYDQNQINQMLALADRTGDIEKIKWSIRAGDTLGVKSSLDKLAQLLWPQQQTAKV